MLINSYRFEAATPLLLDLYPGAAAAYSLRRLRTAYEGAVVRARRSIDNTEQDFTAPQVTNGTLTTFCGAGNGFVRTWYDQSGNGNHAGQATTGNQPQIVSGGSLATDGTKPAITFSSTPSKWLDAVDSTSLRPAAVSMLVACSTTDITTVQAITGKNFGESYTLSYGTAFVSSKHRPSVDNVAAPVSVETAVSSPSSLASNARYLLFQSYDLDQLRGGHNGSVAYSVSATGAILYSTLPFRIGALGEGSFPLLGKIQEVVVFSSAQVSNRAAIEASINSHYAIF